MTCPALSGPDHAPLKPCPFCERDASAMPHRATSTSPVQWSVGCWRTADPFSQAAHRDDCPGPTTLRISLEQAVKHWNRWKSV